MDERTDVAPGTGTGHESVGPSCAIDRSCCGGGADAAQEVSPIVDACTLDPKEMPERLARWQALFAQNLGHEQRNEAAVFRFEQTSALDAELQELVKLEQICCAHVGWELKSVGDETHLTLKADAGALEALVRGFTSGGLGGAS